MNAVRDVNCGVGSKPLGFGSGSIDPSAYFTKTVLLKKLADQAAHNFKDGAKKIPVVGEIRDVVQGIA